LIRILKKNFVEWASDQDDPPQSWSFAALPDPNIR